MMEMASRGRWHAALDAAGIRATRNRVLVLDVLARHTRPATILSLHAELREQGERIGLTTVYRTVSSLVGGGLVHVFGQAGTTAYRLCGPARHHHLVCRLCGLVVERPDVDDLDGFRVEEAYGVCANCGREPPKGPS